MSPISLPPILVSSSEVVLEQRPKEKSPLGHLAKDQTVTAKVIEVVSGRRALLLIAGQKVSAKTFLPLQAGQTVLLKVTQAGSRQVFKFEGLASDTPDPRLPMSALGKSQPYLILSRLLDDLQPLTPDTVPGAMKHLSLLRTLVARLSLQSDVPVQGFLKQLLGGSGLLWESKLAALVSRGEPPTPAAVERLVAGDLKALVLQLLSDPRALAAAGSEEPITEQLKGVLEGMERHQLLNRHLLENEGRYLLPIPLSEQQSLRFGQLLIGLGNREKSRKPEERVVTVSFLLSLSHLGELRADFSILKSGLTGVFGVADEAAQALVSQYLPELRQKLLNHGFSVYDISCRVLEPQQLSEMSLVAQAVSPTDDGFFNLVV